jgi:hypothetical protein
MTNHMLGEIWREPLISQFSRDNNYTKYTPSSLLGRGLLDCHYIVIVLHPTGALTNFLHIIFFLHQFNHCLTGNAFYHIQHIITNAICQRLIPQQPNKTTPPMVSQGLHPFDPAAPQLPANSLTSRSLLAACRPMLVLAIAA